LKKSLVSEDDYKLLTGVRCVCTALHGCIDFGHVLTGLDACVNCKKAHSLLDKKDQFDSKSKIESAVTWAGDVGSAVQATIGVSEKDFEDEWGILCHPDDLLGDVDGIVLGTRIRKKGGGFTSLAQELEQYYGAKTRMQQKDVFRTFNDIYAKRALNPSFIRDHVRAFLRAARTSDIPNDKDVLAAIERSIKRWQKFLVEHWKGPKKHCCTNDWLKKERMRRWAYNRERKGRYTAELTGKAKKDWLVYREAREREILSGLHGPRSP
jgi:hypothetical protein